MAVVIRVKLNVSLLLWCFRSRNCVIMGYQVNLQQSVRCQSGFNFRLPNSSRSGRRRYAQTINTKKAMAQGFGVCMYSQFEIIELQLSNNELRMLSDLLSERPFYFDDEATFVRM